jgi:hypothetical protein
MGGKVPRRVALGLLVLFTLDINTGFAEADETEPWSLRLLTNLPASDWFNQSGELHSTNIFCNPGVIIGSSSTPTARAI